MKIFKLKYFTLWVAAGGVGFVFNAQAALPISYVSTPQVYKGNATTPNLFERQKYLLKAPIGVGALEAWKLPGGRGENVKIIDIEVGFEDLHEDLAQPFFNDENSRADVNHGTAVWGVIHAKNNEYGITGIAHQAQFGIFGFEEGMQAEVDAAYIKAITRGIKRATQVLSAGDVLVIEQHMEGPDTAKYTAVEYWDEIFAALKEATDRGILCIEAAGNGNSDFDSKAYQGKFDLKVRDSGCIMVGAGGLTHDRMWFSNYGSRIDAYGYGENVTTLGYGDLFNGGPTRMYTGAFNGTSSATPIVAGAVAVLSSILKQQGKVLTPADLRIALRTTGTPQSASTASKRIGNLPDLEALIRFFPLY